jgi:ribosomal protein L14E/L6E/L27E
MHFFLLIRLKINKIASDINLKKKTIGLLVKSKKYINKRNKWINFLDLKKNARYKKTMNFMKKVSKDKIKPLPGTILILLNKKMQGKKAILLKTTESNLFIISGPFSLNGISLRRVNPRYTISTENKIDLQNLSLQNLNDEYFNYLIKIHRSKDLEKKMNIFSSHYLRQMSIDKEILRLLKKKIFYSDYLKTITLFNKN